MRGEQRLSEAEAKRKLEETFAKKDPPTEPPKEPEPLVRTPERRIVHTPEYALLKVGKHEFKVDVKAKRALDAEEWQYIAGRLLTLGGIRIEYIIYSVLGKTLKEKPGYTIATSFANGDRKDYRMSNLVITSRKKNRHAKGKKKEQMPQKQLPGSQNDGASAAERIFGKATDSQKLGPRDKSVLAMACALVLCDPDHEWLHPEILQARRKVMEV